MADYDEFMRVVLEDVMDEELPEDIDVDNYGPEADLGDEDLALRAYDEILEGTDAEYMFDFQVFD